jgi:hypothetical protein
MKDIKTLSLAELERETERHEFMLMISKRAMETTPSFQCQTDRLALELETMKAELRGRQKLAKSTAVDEFSIDTESRLPNV